MSHKLKFLTRHLFLQVRDVLAARVASGEWKAGSMVPNEAQLAHELGVSQGTVRKALDVMEAEKIVVRQQGRGTFVVDHDTEAMAIRFSSIFAANQKIDGEIACQACEASPTDEEALTHLDAVASDTIFRCRRLHSHHGHKFMWDESTIVMRHWPGLTGSEMQTQGQCVRLSSLAQKFGVLLSHATETVMPVLAEGVVCEKLDIDPGRPLLYLERTVFSDKSVRVEWRRAWLALRGETYMSVTS